MATPTPIQIAYVQANLANMVIFTNVINLYGQELIVNSFALLVESDNKDLGLDIVLNLICGGFWAIGSECGPIGAISANFLAGCVNRWKQPDCTPQSLLTSFQSMYSRFNKSCIELTNQLAIYSSDPEKYWNEQFTYQEKTVTLGDLSTIVFPAIGNEDFQIFQTTALFALDQNIWQTNLQHFCAVTTFTMTQHKSMKEVNKKGGPDGVLNDFYSGKYGKSDYLYLVYNPGHKMQTEGYDYYTLHLGHSIKPDHFGSLSDAAYNYIFRNTTPTNITNPCGLWAREYLFGPIDISYPFTAHHNNLGIPAENNSA